MRTGIDPFFIEGPAMISLSGGRTSGYMLHRILERGLSPEAHILFSNTGKEDNRTLDFVNEMGHQWGVKIRWLEYRRKYLPTYKSPEVAIVTAKIRKAFGFHFEPLPKGMKEPGFEEVSYETAARTDDEPSPRHPFLNMAAITGIPNASTRLCTTEMKIRVMKKFMLAQGYDEWTNVVGIRSDEPRRVARMRAPTGQRWENTVPLADAGVTVEDVLAFWKAQRFDLKLANDPVLGTYEGNCDFCHLKSEEKKVRLARERPASVKWWQKLEEVSGSQFRLGTPYAKVVRLALLAEPKADAEDLGDCICHD